MLNKTELYGNLINFFGYDSGGESAERIRDVIDDAIALGEQQERKRIRDEIESKSFETAIDDGYEKVVSIGDIDIWKD